MIAIIRIKGQTGLREKINETFKRLNLGKKYSCTLINEEDKIKMGMLKKVSDFVAFGKINDETLKKLIESRVESLEKKKIDAKKIFEEIKKGKKTKEIGIKPSFRLHPARGGIKSKIHFPKGVLGNNKEEINKLIERML